MGKTIDLSSDAFLFRLEELFFFFYHYSPLLYNLNKPSSLRGKENKGGREGRLQVSWDRNLILLRRALGP